MTQDIEFKGVLEDLFAEGFRDFPSVNPTRAESEPYRLGFSAAAQIDQLEAQRAAVLAQAKALSGGAVRRPGFI